MKKLIVIVIILGIVGYGSWVAYQKIKAAESPAGMRRAAMAVPVEIQPVIKDTIQDVGIFTGSLTPKSQFTVAPKVSGWLKELFVNVGDTVTRNQVIAVLDDADYTQQVEQAKAELQVAKANAQNSVSELELVKREYERIQALREKQIASASEFDGAEAAYNSSKTRLEVSNAQVEQKTAALKSAELKLSYTKVQAFWESDNPNAMRVVGERFVDVGTLLQVNQPIVSILENDLLVAVIFVVEKDYSKIKINQNAIIDTDAFPGETFTGKIVRIAPLLIESSRQARVEIEIPNPKQLLKPGMFVRTNILFATHENVTLVPRAAVVRRNDTEGVFIVDTAQKKVSFVPVTTGIVNNEVAEILKPELSGFVATLGNHMLEDGSGVTLPQEKKTDK
ncbi:MAG: efflux RND transporter periplasmic adaptor subunit [Sedimentisphaerales bacterium]|nr:efflux RND transporter periplasmic adaptor subunit [Sedimentisphaerales bacterium]